MTTTQTTGPFAQARTGSTTVVSFRCTEHLPNCTCQRVHVYPLAKYATEQYLVAAGNLLADDGDAEFAERVRANGPEHAELLDLAVELGEAAKAQGHRLVPWTVTNPDKRAILAKFDELWPDDYVPVVQETHCSHGRLFSEDCADCDAF
ncbi:MAG: hypothetical protein QM714_00150 [Nocardioides sp.]|uniref:hypothetical protein n=1 Tax=Nocardioides sp. TaxID=35761 RepID=UPI0039E374C0